MKILATSDIHQFGDKWKKLVDVAIEKKPDVVAISGDLYPKSNGLRWHMDFMKSMRKYAAKIRETSELVFILGNDDNNLTIPEIDAGEKEGLWYCVHDRIAEIGGFQFCGCSWVPDYPFTYKYWVASETSEVMRICPRQLGEPCIMGQDNNYVKVDGLREYMSSKETIYDHLISMSKKVTDPRKSIWLIHAPPANTGLDVCASGERVGSYAVLKFLSDFQPLLSIHGHIHESPEYNGGKWMDNINDTICIQQGQITANLYYVDLEIGDGKIVSAHHSIYGDSRYDFS